MAIIGLAEPPFAESELTTISAPGRNSPGSEAAFCQFRAGNHIP